MNRREMISGTLSAPLATGSTDRTKRWFVGETARPIIMGNAYQVERQGEVILRVDEIYVLESVDHNATGTVVIGNAAITLMPESYARLRKQWAEYWGIKE